MLFALLENLCFQALLFAVQCGLAFHQQFFAFALDENLLYDDTTNSVKSTEQESHSLGSRVPLFVSTMFDFERILSI